jgi:predicted Na+-dependent transporter
MRHGCQQFRGKLFVGFGVWAYTFFPRMTATTMMIIAGSMANLALAAAMFHTAYVNTRFLPPSMRPSVAKRAAMVVSGLFFLAVFGLVANQKLRPLLGL